MTSATFRELVWRHYKKYGRHDLPWRPPSLKLRKGKKDNFLYSILVSEIMLQQTQVDRVIPFYTTFIQKFPTAKKLAQAKLSDVLKAWQGLGYNRRAKMLHQAAKVLSEIPRSNLGARFLRFDLGISGLEKLPGVGPYTARAVAAFAYNQDTIVIETNIRTVIIQHFFANKKKVSDTEIEKVLTRVLPKGKAREWYSALMDYGAYLKRSGISHNAKSTKQGKQSKFSGSLREARGAILHSLAREPATRFNLVTRLNLVAELVIRALDDLSAEGFVKRIGRKYTLAD